MNQPMPAAASMVQRRGFPAYSQATTLGPPCSLLLHRAHPIIHLVHGACRGLGFVALTGSRFLVTTCCQGDQAEAADDDDE